VTADAVKSAQEEKASQSVFHVEQGAEDDEAPRRPGPEECLVCGRLRKRCVLVRGAWREIRARQREERERERGYYKAWSARHLEEGSR